jgi:hypothetical protein
MKCIRLVGQGVPVRVSDAEAFQIVERDDGDGEYCSKSFFKDWYQKKTPQTERGQVRPVNVAKPGRVLGGLSQ